MFQVKLIMVGTNYSYTLTHEINTISLKDIYMELIRDGIILKKLIECCKFITSGKVMMLDESFIINDILNIFIVTQSDDMRSDLIKIFKNDSNNEELIDTNDSISTKEDIEYQTKLMDYFEDSNFLILLNIIKSNPEYMVLANSYLSHGNIIEEINLDNIDINNEYNDIYNELKQRVDLSYWSEDNVKKVLTFYKGNMNLTMRYLLI
jgi:hypothetical protein